MLRKKIVSLLYCVLEMTQNWAYSDLKCVLARASRHVLSEASWKLQSMADLLLTLIRRMAVKLWCVFLIVLRLADDRLLS